MVDTISNPREMFMQALKLFQQGDVDHSIKLCQQLLSINPNEINTLRLSAQIAHRQGQLERADQLFNKVIKLAPDYAHAYADRALLFKALGRLDEAVVSIQKALDLDKNLHGLRNLLQQWLLEQGQEEAAEEEAGLIVKRKQFREKIQEAFDLFESESIDESRELAADLLRQDSGNIVLKILLVDIALKNHNSQRAEKLCREVIAKVPENWQVWNRLSRALMNLERTEEAQEALRYSRQVSNNNADTILIEASIAIKDGDYEEGIKLLSGVLEQDPKRNQARSQLGLALKTVGRQDEAIAMLRECIAEDNRVAEAWWALSDMKTFKFTDQELADAEEILQKGQLDSQNQVFMGYAIGKAMEHRKQYPQAFSAYQRANKLKKTLVDYSSEENTLFTDQLINSFTPELFERWKNLRCSEAQPIFIVSLPRSGSTLQEQILASHSRVEGTDELPYLTRMSKRLHSLDKKFRQFPAGIEDVNEQALIAMAEDYIEKASFHRHTDKPYFIDKLPNNFNYVGLIALLFPRAKIINARRHPMDSCLGCYKQHWALGQYFTYDLEDLGHYYADYDRLMKHWHRVLPGRILDVQYEDVVDDLEGNVKRVLDFCELPFEDSCLEFYNTKRAVKTSSSEQVRKPIYRSALAYWKNFDKQLEPLKNILGDLIESDQQ